MGHTDAKTTLLHVDQEVVEVGHLMRLRTPSELPDDVDLRNLSSSKAAVVGDTGFEPVTSTV